MKARDANTKDMKEYVFMLRVQSLRVNYQSAWIAPTIVTSIGSAFAVEEMGENYIVTNAHVVRHATRIDLEYGSSGMMCEAKPLTRSAPALMHSCDLAFLEIPKPSEHKAFWDVAKTFLIRDAYTWKGKISAIGYPMTGGELSITEGKITSTDIQSYVHSNTQLILHQTDAVINPGNSGGPVVAGEIVESKEEKKDEIAGVAFQGRPGTGIASIIPGHLVKRCIQDLKSFGRFMDFPDLSLQIQSMENSTMRKAYGLNPLIGENLGILISKVNALSVAKHILKKDDIIFEIKGVSINKNGKAVCPKIGKPLFVSHIITECSIDEKIPIKIVRNGVIKTVEVQLSRKINEAALYRFQYDMPYYIFRSGIMIQELTINYVQSFIGASGYSGPSAFYSILSSKYVQSNINKHKKKFFIAEIFSFEGTEFLNQYKYSVIYKINGRTIDCVWDVIKAFDQNNASTNIHKIVFTNKRQIFVPIIKPGDPAEIQIRKKYGIPEPQSANCATADKWRKLAKILQEKKKQKESKYAVKVKVTPIEHKAGDTDAPVVSVSLDIFSVFRSERLRTRIAAIKEEEEKMNELDKIAVKGPVLGF